MSWKSAGHPGPANRTIRPPDKNASAEPPVQLRPVIAFCPHKFACGRADPDVRQIIWLHAEPFQAFMGK